MSNTGQNYPLHLMSKFRHLTDAIHANSVNLSFTNVQLKAQKHTNLTDKTNIMTESAKQCTIVVTNNVQ